MTILDQRMHAWRAEQAAECGEFGRAEILVMEHKHRMFGECAPDPCEVASSRGFERSMPNASVPSASPSGRSWGELVIGDPPTVSPNRRGRKRSHDRALG